MESNGQKQREMYPVSPVPKPHMAPEEFVAKASFVGVLRYCVQRSGLDDYEVADKLHISHGYMAKVLKGTATLSGDRLLRFMEVTQCTAPAQWYAFNVGGDIVLRDPAKARIAELERELNELKRAA